MTSGVQKTENDAPRRPGAGDVNRLHSRHGESGWFIRGKMGGRTFGVQSLRVLACRALMSTLAGPEVLLSLLPLATLDYTVTERFQARVFAFCASMSRLSCS